MRIMKITNGTGLSRVKLLESGWWNSTFPLLLFPLLSSLLFFFHHLSFLSFPFLPIYPFPFPLPPIPPLRSKKRYR